MEKTDEKITNQENEQEITNGVVEETEAAAEPIKDDNSEKEEIKDDNFERLLEKSLGNIQNLDVGDKIEGEIINITDSLIFVSYQVSGTLGSRIQRGFREFNYIDDRGRTQLVKLNLNVFTLEGFSGHSSRSQISQFLRRIQPRPKLIITNHGEESKVVSLATMIHKKLRKATKAPKNMETIVLR